MSTPGKVGYKILALFSSMMVSIQEHGCFVQITFIALMLVMVGFDLMGLLMIHMR